MKKILLVFLMLNFALFAKQTVKLQLSWLHQFQFAGYYIAKEKGFYDLVGLDVEIKEFTYGLDVSGEIKNGNADFGVGRSSLIIDRFNGEDIVALAAIYQKSPLMLLVTKESGINSIEDLKDRNIMITSDAKSAASIIAMLNSHGLSINDINIQQHSFNLEDLINGKTDAMASYISNEPIRLQDMGIDYKIFHPQNYGFHFYDDILYSSSQYIDANPQITKNFFDATMRGWKYAFENIAETAEIIYNQYNTQNKTMIQLVKEGEALKELAYDRTDHQIGCLDNDLLKRIESSYKLLGFINGEIDFDTFVYEHNPHKFYSFRSSDTDIIFGVLVISLCILLVLYLITYVVLKQKWLLTKNQLNEEIQNTHKDLKKQKKLLEYQYEKVETIINSSNEIIVFKDENLNYIHCNNYFSDFFSKDKEEIIGKNDYFLFDKDVADYLRSIYLDILKSKEEKVLKEWLQFPNLKDKKLLRLFVKPLEYELGKTGLVIFASDITQQYYMEEEKLKNQKVLLEHSKISAISKLVNNIAHQWRQPLSIISINLSGVSAKIEMNKEIDKDDLNSVLEKSIKQTQYLSDTIDDFRKYFDDNMTESKETNTNNIFNKINNFIAHELEENKVQHIKSIETISCTTYDNLLIQSLINIYENSIDAFNKNEITNSDRYVFTKVKESDESIVIKIKDSGKGISEDIFDNIFEPYVTSKHQYIGVGLSLYITYSIIVEQLGGEISVTNAEYQYDGKDLTGAEFVIEIPKM